MGRLKLHAKKYTGALVSGDRNLANPIKLQSIVMIYFVHNLNSTLQLNQDIVRYNYLSTVKFVGSRNVLACLLSLERLFDVAFSLSYCVERLVVLQVTASFQGNERSCRNSSGEKG